MSSDEGTFSPVNIFLERDPGKVILLTNTRTLAGICGLEELAVPWKTEAKNGVGLDKLEKSTQAAWEGPASGTPKGLQGVPGRGPLSSCICWSPAFLRFLLYALKHALAISMCSRALRVLGEGPPHHQMHCFSLLKK